jgi:hypothetical protein
MARTTGYPPHLAATRATRAAVAAALGVDPVYVVNSRMLYGKRSITLTETAITALLELLATPADTTAEPTAPAGWMCEEVGGGGRVFSRQFSPYFAWMSDAEDAGTIPEEGRGVLVCIYITGDDVLEPIDSEVFDTIADATAWVTQWDTRYNAEGR